jgi:hypothetical protein
LKQHRRQPISALERTRIAVCQRTAILGQHWEQIFDGL